MNDSDELGEQGLRDIETLWGGERLYETVWSFAGNQVVRYEDELPIATCVSLDDAAAIASAPTDLAALITEVRRLRAQLPALLAVVDAAHDWRNAYESNDPSDKAFEAMNAALDALREAQQ